MGEETHYNRWVKEDLVEEIERLQLLVGKLNGGEELQTIMAENERLKDTNEWLKESRCELIAEVKRRTAAWMLAQKALNRIEDAFEYLYGNT